MSHFYGTIASNHGIETRRGHKTTGLITHAAGHGGAIRVDLEHRNGQDRFTVSMCPWRGEGEWVLLAAGILGKAGSVERRATLVSDVQPTEGC